jgi:hypothetical protein
VRVVLCDVCVTQIALDATVNILGEDHLGLLVMGVFPVVVPAANFEQNYVRHNEGVGGALGWREIDEDGAELEKRDTLRVFVEA